MTDLTNAIDTDDNSPENALDDALDTQDGQKRSLRGAINAYCKSCGYDPTRGAGLGAWREQITDCTVTKCALYDVRPVSKPKKTPLSS